MPEQYLQYSFPFDLPYKDSETVDRSKVISNSNNCIGIEDRAIHDWYRFVLSYPPHLVRDYIKDFELSEKSVILDPFCGTGTTLVEAKLNRIKAIGLETNPFPNMQGMVCDHLCQYKCTRMNYERPLLIREIKRFIAQKQDQVNPRKPAAPNGLKVAIIGAGPSGLACAYFLALDGFTVDVYETKDIPGGMAADGIPAFRLDDESLKKKITERPRAQGPG